ncbi:MAG: hypothetical protein AAGH99_00380 [Planctomycetota bacterium]
MRTSPLRRLMQSICRQATSTRPDARQRGSVLVLASVIVVLLALLGASYVQMARVDRRATQALDNRSQDYDGSIIRFIGNILRADIFNSDYEYLTTGAAPGSPEIEKFDYPWTNPTSHNLVIDKWLGQATAVENDGAVITLPLTLNPATATGTTTVELPDGSTTTVDAALGGSGDDHWLAAIEPDFAAGVWPHLSNVTGTNLDLSEESIENTGTFATTPTSPVGTPHVYASTPSNDLESGVTNVQLSDVVDPDNSGLFADADGDNVPDARWTYAPLPPSNGLTFVAAYRIIDNSAKTDINTLTGYNSAATGNAAPRWYWPGELDMSEAFIDNVGGATNGNAVRDEIQLTGRDLSANPLFPERYANWLLGSRRYGKPADNENLPEAYDRIGSGAERLLTTGEEDPSTGGPFTFTRIESRENESELTWRHGLNRSSDNIAPPDPVTEIENIDPSQANSYWRQNNLETEFDDAGFGTNYQFYIEQNPRLRFTTLSGDAERDRVHLNQNETDPLTGDIVPVPPAEFANSVEENFPGGKDLDSHFPPVAAYRVWQSEAEFLDQVAASLYDFRDGFDASGNDALTNIGDSHGMEYLPFISEVFVQARYQLDPITIDAVTGEATLNWVLQDNLNNTGATVPAVEVAIELTNPWPFPIVVNGGAQLVFTDAMGLIVADWGLLKDLLDDVAVMNQTELPGGGGDVVLLPNAVVTLLLNDSDGDATAAGANKDEDNAGMSITDNNDGVYAATGSDPINLNNTATAAAPLAWPTRAVTGSPAANINEVFLELRMPDDTGADVTYQRFVSADFPDTWQATVAAADVPNLGGGNGYVDDALGYIQISTQGTANGFSAMTVDDDDLTNERVDNGDTTAAAVGVSSMPAPGAGSPMSPGNIQFGTLDKGINSRTDSDMLDDRVGDGLTVATAGTAELEPFLIPSAEVIYRSGDLFRVVFLGPKSGVTPKTIAEVWQETTDRVAMNGMRPASPREFRIRDFMLSPYELYDGGAFSNVVSSGGLIPVLANFEGGAAPVDTESAVSWGTFFLDRVTTLSPDQDGVDNDGDNRLDRTNDPDENLIPGRININTASFDTLDRALPIQDATDRANLVNFIIDARTNPFGDLENFSFRGGDLFFTTLNPNGNPNQQGIAFLGELLNDPTFPSDLAADAAMGARPALLNEFTDFNEYEQGVSTNTSFTGLGPSTSHDTDEAELDHEELTLPLSYLNQVASVRSDVFTTYVLVRGYPTGNFGQNGYDLNGVAIPSEEYRLVFTMDRSVVHEDRPQPRVISVARFNPN